MQQLTDINTRLDLTAANHAILVEPQWNPMLEEQALSRVYRLGQTKPVKLVRLIMRDTWEEKIQWVQKQKRTFAELVTERTKLSKGDDGKRLLLVS
jgi:SWI/SNF-related matrix-associated actin-dependent regulator of chromatin subfamily A3